MDNIVRFGAFVIFKENVLRYPVIIAEELKKNYSNILQMEHLTLNGKFY